MTLLLGCEVRCKRMAMTRDARWAADSQLSCRKKRRESRLQFSIRMEAKRLILRAIVERGRALSSLTTMALWHTAHICGTQHRVAVELARPGCIRLSSGSPFADWLSAHLRLVSGEGRCTAGCLSSATCWPMRSPAS